MASSSDSLNSFTFKLYKSMASGKGENYFVSPFSISSALSMCQVGARNETATQLKTLLGVDKLTNEEINKLNSDLLTSLNSNLGEAVTLSVANKIYPNEGYEINKDFLATIQKDYQSTIQQLNFADNVNAANTINKWVSEKTHDKIKNLVPADVLDALTRLVLVNAIYFKGSWVHKFNKDHTTKEDFHLRDGTTQKVDMMKLTTEKFKLQQNPGGLAAWSCEFPYVGHSVSMTIILPHEGVKIEDVESKLNEDAIKAVLNYWENPVKVHAYVPKFKLDFKEEISAHLKSMGAPLPFDMNKADFTGINDKGGLFISKCIHNAVVEVTEEGTVAAAATAVVMTLRCAMVHHEAPPEEFRCDRPFIFIIHENQNRNILFLGKHMKPTSA